MSLRLASTRAYLSLIRSWMSSASKGGRWALAHPEEVQRNLRNFWLDGLFANASDSIILTYLPLYLLALGATGTQIGLMSSIAGLTATILLLPGAWLVEKLGKRKSIVVIAGGTLGRSMILLIVLSPFIFPDAFVVYAAISFAILREGLGNLAHPSWVSLTSDLVPISWRGRYFASRNIIMGVGGMGTILAAGYLITHIGQPVGYQVALGAAYLLGMTATFFFSRLKEPPMARTKAHSFNLRDIQLTLGSNRPFLMFALAAGVWNFSLNISGPFFSVFMAKGLLLSPATIGVLGIFTTLAGLPSQRLMGPLADRWGPRRVQMLTGFLIPILPIMWVFVQQPWHIAVLNVVAGLLWSGFNLAAFNMLLTMSPPEHMARTSALYQMVVMISLSAGAAFGSLIFSFWSYHGVFILSAVGRLVGALLFSLFVPGRPTAGEPAAPA